MNYQSNASWTKIKNTHDEHMTEGQAQGVCDILMQMHGKRGTPCIARGTCIRTWVTPIYKKKPEEK